MIRLSLVSVGVVEENASALLVLRSPELERLLIMEIGMLEGRAIALEAEGIRTPRPLTHDLLYRVIQELGARVAEVQIRDFRDKTFFANLVLTREGGETIIVDARPSDAIALALRAKAPIYVDEAVLAAAGMDEKESELETVWDLDDDDGENRIVH
ncbi:MAG TPA: bifunctional nuclease family protein [Symbiobacteriaceae bacterium]